MIRIFVFLMMTASTVFSVVFAEDSTDEKVRIDSLEQRTEKLEKDVENLKREMHQFRLIIAEQKGDKTAVSKKMSSDDKESVQGIESQPADCDTCYWCTPSGKRHNSTCKYYRTTKGRPCGPNEGTACKLCGG
jgi:hypothetical protein